MLLANIHVPRNLKIPKAILDGALNPEITTSSQDLPLGASDWIACRYACPHTDPGWTTTVFITLSVVSSHDVGDAFSEEPLLPVPRGTLFVIDPLVRHWLFSRNGQRIRQRRWIGLQWEVGRSDAMVKARELVVTFGGFWTDSNDRRYAHWNPQKRLKMT